MSFIRQPNSRRKILELIITKYPASHGISKILNNCKLRFISSTGPIFNQLEQAVQTRAVPQINQPLLGNYKNDLPDLKNVRTRKIV